MPSLVSKPPAGPDRPAGRERTVRPPSAIPTSTGVRLPIRPP